MSKQSTARVFSRPFKLYAVRRMLAGANVSELARELGVLRKDLYVWRDRFRAGGPEALRSPGRPRKAWPLEPAPSVPVVPELASAMPAEGSASELAAARQRIAELEAKIGQQQMDLDFFRRALRQVREAVRPSDGSGATRSTRSSKR